MPLVRIELFERRLTPELESALIERMTETLLEVLDAPELKEHTWVIVEGHAAHRRGRNAKPWDEGGSCHADHRGKALRQARHGRVGSEDRRSADRRAPR